jgi:3-oxoacyl-[acyl-carrier protein] reductase
MDLGLQGTRAAVAASSAGLGLGVARALAAEGVRVALCGRDPSRLEWAVNHLVEQGASPDDVLAVTADVSTPEGAAGFVDRAHDALDGLDILVTNAGGPPPGTFATTEIGAYREALELNLLSTVAMCQEALPAMRQRGWGRVVAITSIGVRQPIGNLIASVTARTGATGFLKVLADEVAAEGITVNSVLPGLHATDRLRQLHGGDVDELARDIPVGFVGDPDEFGAVVAFLCSRQARFITGAAIPVEGGAIRGLL